MYPQKAQSRETRRSDSRSRRYVAHHTYVVIRERAFSTVSETPGTIWRGVRRRGQFRSGIFSVRDNNLSLVFVSVGGGRCDFVAVIVIQGAVAVATFHLQRGSGCDKPSDGT